jgi:FtsZ-interacting cell division protein ZipA
MDFTSNGMALILLGVVVLVALALFAWWLTRRRRSAGLKERFGPEYEHEIEVAGDRATAEDELQARRKRVKEYELDEIPPEDRQRFSARWQEVQMEFVDHPGRAVADAARLIDEAMEARGYPLGELQRKEADLSVHYPREVQDYRRAWEIAERHQRGEATTEELREATVCYRSLFEHLVGIDEAAESHHDERDRKRETAS